MSDFVPTFDGEKFRRLLLYIAYKTMDDTTFGAVKLNKVLYYSDFEAYRRLGNPITGATYQKLAEGPAPRELLQERNTLVREGDVEIEAVPVFTGMTVHHLTAPRQPDITVFKDGELLIVNNVIEWARGKTAREISDFSHQEPGWALAQESEDIPYFTAWLSADPVEQSVRERAHELAQGLP